MEWTESDEQRLLELLRYEDSIPSLTEHINRVSPQLPPPRHLEPLIKAWERTRYETVFAVVEMPPRHAKSTTCIHGFSWRITYDQGKRNAVCAYGDDLAKSFSRKIRNQVQACGVELATTNVHHWETLYEGGLAATGIGGPLTGKGITGVALVDDPIKNRQEAESALIRDRIWEWFTDVVWTRLEEGASVFVVQTRWHKDDLVGRLLNGFEDPESGEAINFERIQLKAIAEEHHDDPLNREPGEALWPERHSVKKLSATRAIIGEYSWASLFQQDPTVKGDRLFAEEPARFRLDPFGGSEEEPADPGWRLDGHRVLISCDPAATEKTKSDHNAILVLAAKGWREKMQMWVIDHFHKQIRLSKVVRRLMAFQKQYWGVAVGVEAAGAFAAVPDMLQEAAAAELGLEWDGETAFLRVYPITPLGDKFTRAQPVAAAYNQQRVHIPIDRPWSRTLIKELEDFTGVSDAADDQVDALAHGWNTLAGAHEPIPRGSTKSRQLPFG